MKIPAIGQTGGIFEIFVPGMFLVLNIGGVGYLCFHERIISIIKIENDFIIGKLGLSIIIIICFSYLAGMLLRLLMTDRPDRLSAWYHRKFNKQISRHAHITDKSLDGLKKINIPQDILTKLEHMKDIKYKNNKKFIHNLEIEIGMDNVQKYKSIILEQAYDKYELWATERFPYIGWLGEAADRHLPKSAHNFYKKIWAPRKKEIQNRRFFNFCKTFLNSQDRSVMSEIYAAESINRYISGMYYSLLISCILLLLSLCSPTGNDHSILLFLLIGVYLLALFGIVSRFRFIRIKEAQIVFDASFKYRDEFYKYEIKEKQKESYRDRDAYH